MISWGFLGASRISTARVLPGLRSARSSRVVAIASRDLGRARSVAGTFGIATAYGSYGDLIADPRVDAIYVALPNHVHAHWSILALEAGKHVLCEKPLAMDAAEAGAVAAAARRTARVAMEAFMYRFHPQWRRAYAIVASGEIGALRSVHTLFAYHNVDPNNIRNMAVLGGGALMDIGCYGVSVARWLFGAEPSRVSAATKIDERFGTDWLVSAILEFDGGLATLTASTQSAPGQCVDIVGAAGRVIVEIPFNAPTDRPCRIFVDRGSAAAEETFEISDQFALQFDAFSEAIAAGRPAPTPIDDAVSNMSVIDSIRRSAQDPVGP
jgi:predicted dehydrogenase